MQTRCRRSLSRYILYKWPLLLYSSLSSYSRFCQLKQSHKTIPFTTRTTPNLTSGERENLSRFKTGLSCTMLCWRLRSALIFLLKIDLVMSLFPKVTRSTKKILQDVKASTRYPLPLASFSSPVFGSPYSSPCSCPLFIYLQQVIPVIRHLENVNTVSSPSAVLVPVPSSIGSRSFTRGNGKSNKCLVLK